MPCHNDREAADPTMRTQPPIAAGEPAADFRLPDADGREHRLADYRGAWLLLVLHRHLR